MKTVKNFRPLLRTMLGQSMSILFRKQDTTSTTGTTERFMLGVLQHILDEKHIAFDEHQTVGGVTTPARKSIAVDTILSIHCQDGVFVAEEQKEFGFTFTWTEGKKGTLSGRWSVNAQNLADAKRKYKTTTGSKSIPRGCKVEQGPVLVIEPVATVSPDLASFYGANKEAVKTGINLLWAAPSKAKKNKDGSIVVSKASWVIGNKVYRFEISTLGNLFFAGRIEGKSETVIVNAENRVGHDKLEQAQNTVVAFLIKEGDRV